MTHEEFLDQFCTMCGTQRCYGEEYCGLYQRYVLGQDSELDKIMWAAKQQLVIHRLSEDAAAVNKTKNCWVKISIDPDKAHWKCSSCGKETDLPNYEQAKFCFNCGTKLLED